MSRRTLPECLVMTLAAAVVAAALLTSCIAPPAARSESQVEEDINLLVNQARQNAGLEPLERSPTLDALAAQFAASGFSELVERYTDIRFLLSNSWRVSYSSGMPRLVEGTAGEQVDYCLASPSLSQAMLRSDADETGLGVAIVGDTVYYVQVFDVLSTVTGDGAPLVLHDNPTAQDPSWAELQSFVLDDDTDEQPYVEDSFVCTDFAAMLHDRAEAEGIRAAYVSVDLADSPGHALDAFNTTDRGLVYIDCTGPGLSFATPGGTASDAPPSYDKVAYLSEGKECGLVSMDTASSFDYAFYEEYLGRWAEYESAADAYKRKQDAYHEALGGRTVISDPDEYAALQAMYEELEDLRLELEALEDALGGYRWESPGTVTGFYVLW
jgi:hypothetical protein